MLLLYFSVVGTFADNVDLIASRKYSVFYQVEMMNLGLPALNKYTSRKIKKLQVLKFGHFKIFVK